MYTQLSRPLAVAFCLSIASCTLTLQGQNAKPHATPTKPVAFVYVSSTPANSSQSVINAFAASSTGQLTPVAGSPFAGNDGGLSVNGDELYGINNAATYLDGYEITKTGALTYQTSTNYAQFNPYGCGFAGALFPDRTGTDLYALNFIGDCANNTYQSYKVDKSGQLTFLGSANGGAGSFSGVYLPLSFLGNNQFAYEATNNGCFYYQVWGFQRTKNGDLNTLAVSAPMPAPPSGYSIYMPDFAAADSANHVAIAMQAGNPPGCSSEPIQIGSFTANAKGDLSTTNTSSDMPNTEITSIYDMKIAPSGKLLAVGGVGGLQILHFNGANPPTRYTGALTTDVISQMFWDENQHLYAISQSSGRLHVYTVTPTSYTEAPGSPYTINQPGNLAIYTK
jgi:hypothetical protein